MTFKEFYNYIMPNVNKKLRMDALAREQKFVDVPQAERLTEERIQKYVELFTEKLIHQQKKIHLIVTDMFIQEMKLIHLFQQDVYKVVVTTSILNPGNQKSQPTFYNAKHKVNSRDVLKYLQSLGLKATWDEVDFLIRRFLYESEYFQVPRPLRWDWNDFQHTDTDDTHFESVELNFNNENRNNVELEIKFRFRKAQRILPKVILEE